MRRWTRERLPRTVGSRVDAVATLMDEVVTVPIIGWSVGLDSVFGLLPFATDAVTLALHLYLLVEGWLAGVPMYVYPAMAGIAFVDTVAGYVPALDTVVKGYAWNRRLLYRFGDVER
jgi:hypothetical protein